MLNSAYKFIIINLTINDLGCSIPYYFEPTNTIRDSYIPAWMSGRHYAAEDRKSGAVTHLAHARIQNRRPGILGNLFERIIEIFLLLYLSVVWIPLI